MKTRKIIYRNALALTCSLAATLNAQYLPHLNISTTGNQSVLLYPTWATNYVLQSVTNLASTNWLAVTNGATAIGVTSVTVTVTNNLPGCFFRLATSLMAQDLYVASYGNYTVGKYELNGQAVNPSLITGLYNPTAMAVSGTNLFVASFYNGTIGEYTTSGATNNASLITGLREPYCFVISGTNIYAVNGYGGTIGEYTTSGTTNNASLITGLSQPYCIAIVGTNLFVANYGTGTVGEYTTSGATVNASLITGINDPTIAIGPAP